MKEIKPHMNHKDMIQQQHTPPEAGPLAASGRCWVTAGGKSEQQRPNYVLIIK